jgi:alpha-tubulin suppressor-like RCC1 family protein
MTRKEQKLAMLAAMFATLTACGGGGGGGASPAAGTSPAATPVPEASATLVSPSSGKFYWNIESAMAVTMKDPQGAAISAITCQSADALAATVATDCSKATLKRLGGQNITVTGGAYTATVVLHAVPQRHWSGQHGAASSAGSGNFSLLALADGTVLSWGANGAGLLGQGRDSSATPPAIALLNSSTPLSVLDSAGTGTLGQVYQVSGGNVNAFALSEDGKVWGWGRNSNCNLAQTSCTTSVLLPVRVRNSTNNGLLSNVVQVEAGDGNQTALLDNGTVMTWGQWTGQGDINQKSFPGLVKTPDGLADLSDIVAISAGSSFSLGLSKLGKVYAWGYDTSRGTLGSGVALSAPSALPNLVKKQDGSDLSGIVSISAGYNFSLALGSDGSVWAWGDNARGQIGQNNLVALGGVPYAVQVKAPAGQAGLFSNIVMVAAGGNHALALDNTGKVYAWGVANNGELGDGPTNPAGNESSLPRAVLGTNGTGVLSGAVSIAANYTNSSALMADGKLMMWGANFRGALGRGEAVGTVFVNSPLPAPVVAGAALTPLVINALSSYPNLKRISR